MGDDYVTIKEGTIRSMHYAGVDQDATIDIDTIHLRPEECVTRQFYEPIGVNEFHDDDGNLKVDFNITGKHKFISTLMSLYDKLFYTICSLNVWILRGRM